MAASIENIEADTGYVDNPLVFALCEPTIDYENARSEIASHFVAGATIFMFCWQAYESAVAATARTELTRLLKEQRLGERGRKLFESRPEISARFIGLKQVLWMSLLQCEHGGLFTDRLNRLKSRYPAPGLILAAELSREFRNFELHGEDDLPEHEDWGSAIVAHCRLSRFYAISRLVLYLIQALAWIEVGEGAESRIISASCGESRPRQVLENLQFVNDRTAKDWR
jgi:hypothetical protein